MLRNSIHSNGGLGIDLNNDGITPNDPPTALDADTGPNGRQNFPVLAAAVVNGATTVIVGRLDSAASTPYVIEFFASSSCDPSGNGEGATFLGRQAVIASDGGSAEVFFSTSATAAAVGQFITATATDFPGDSTSEFSPCVTVTTLPVVTVSATEPMATEAGQTSGVLTFSRTGDTAAALTVFFTVAGTATPGADYAALPASVQIPAGQASATVLVTAVDDGVAEGNETVTATVSASAAYVVGNPSGATVTIADDESPPVPPTVTVAATGPTATEAAITSGTLTFTRTGSTAAALSVFFTVAGTASAFDYQTLPVSVVIPAGEASATLSVVPVDDGLVEGEETVIVELSANAAYVVGDPSAATVAIADDDVVPSPLPQLTGALNQIAFQTGQTLTLNVLLTPGTAPTLVDAYVVVQLPGGAFVSVLLTGAAGGILPIATSFAPFAFSGQLIAYTFTGIEAPGTYTVFIALTQPGTLTPIRQIQMLTFTFTP